jgi:hypothetical protein
LEGNQWTEGRLASTRRKNKVQNKMTRTSILALVAAATLAFTPAAFAQADVTATTGAAVTVDTNGDGNISAEEQAAADAAAQTSGGGSAEGSASASLTIDANADGTISAEEVAAANAAITASGDASIQLDANGDGTISLEEAAAVEAALAALSTVTVACEPGGLSGMMSKMVMADSSALESATDVKLVLVSNCAASEVSSELATEGATNIRKALEVNATAVAALQARGATTADVLGATVDGNTVTVYIAATSTGT